MGTQTEDSQLPLPFPEWSDSALNSEIWDLPKEKAAPKDHAPPVAVPETVYFEDIQMVSLPSSIVAPSEWKRPTDLFPNENLVIYKESSQYSNLLDGSKHLLHSEFFRYFLATVGVMEYIGGYRPFTSEGVSPNFTPTTDSEPWRPWHYVYSLTKAGKGQKHRPLANRLGKYVVRLFWMGCWRKITVDDTIPVDEENKLLLPSFPIIRTKVLSTVSTTATDLQSKPDKKKGGAAKGKPKKEKKGAKQDVKETVELWPFILCKALLKVASLTWNDQQEILDFDMIHCLTGWIVQKIDTRDLSISDKWEVCMQFSDHYAWADDLPKSQMSTAKSKGKKRGSSKSSGKNAKSGPSILAEKYNMADTCYLIGVCDDMSSSEGNEVPDVSPCCSHLFLIDQSRDIPLLKPEPQPELERWKRFRWLAWAIQKGLRHPDLCDMDPIKCIKLVSTLRGSSKPDGDEAACIKKSVELIEGVALEAAKEKSKVEIVSPSSKGTDKKSKSSASSGKGGKKKGEVQRLEDISVWCDFTKMWLHVDYLHIYFKPSKFETKLSITNTFIPVAADAMSSVINHSISLNEFDNQPLYLFVDTLDYKFIVFTLSQPGMTKNLMKAKVSVAGSVETYENQASLNEVEYECIDYEDYCSYESCKTISPPVYSMGCFILEEFNWQSEGNTGIKVFLNSIGVRSVLKNFERGRFCMKLWLEFNEQYVLNIISDATVVVGSLEMILDHMTTESHRLLDTCFKASSYYGQLVQSFGTPTYLDYLRQFYNPFKPDTLYRKVQLENICNAFLDEVLCYLEKNLVVKNDYTKCFSAMRVLFMNTRIGFATDSSCRSVSLVTTDSVNSESITSEDVSELKKKERAAVTIQAFFKRIYVRKLKQRHSQIDKDYLSTFDYLKRVYTMCFSVEKRSSVCLQMLRKVLKRPEFQEYYSWVKDLNNVVNIQSFRGMTVIPSSNWIPICRYVFYCQQPYPVTVKICLFGEVKKYVLRVFDNDTGQEMPRHTYSCNVQKYKPNTKGYTVLCYAWWQASTTAKQITWRLIFVTLREQQESSLQIKDPNLETNTLTLGYLPNVYNQIFNCNISLHQDTLATFRLNTSGECPSLQLKCLKDGKTVAQICGKGCIVLPVVFLDNGTTEDLRSVSKQFSLKKKQSSSRSGMSMDGSRRHKDSKSDRTSVSSKPGGRLKGSISKEDRSMRNEMMYKLEAFVLEDSWPLTAQEWMAVKGWKKMQLLHPEASLQKIREGSISKRIDNASRTNERKRSNTDMEKPFWCLQTVIDKGDQVRVNKDTTREEEIKEIKRMWYSGNPSRYEDSWNIRNEYLQQLYQQSDGSSQSETSATISSGSVTSIRTPRFPDIIQKSAVADELLCRYSSKTLSEDEMLDRKLKTLEDDEEEARKIEENIRESYEAQDKFQLDMNNYLLNQIERCSVLKGFITNCRSETSFIMDTIKQMRQAYVDSICPPGRPGQKGKGKGKK